jgi:hypothetical protein
MGRVVLVIVIAAILYAPGRVLARDIPFLQIGDFTISLGDSAGDVREAFGTPDWEETQKNIKVYRGRRSYLVREVSVWWYRLDDGWGKPSTYGFFVLEGEVVRIRQTGVW